LRTACCELRILKQMINLFYTFISPAPSRREEQKAQHLAGRQLLCGALRCTPAWLEENLRYGEAQKPYLPGGLFFNLSHSGRLVLLALTSEGEIGCDVEDLSRPVHSEGLIRRRIAKPGEENTPLLELWVKYEAEYKAGGPGQMFFPPMPKGYVAAVCVRGNWDGEMRITQADTADSHAR
jgi:hypothetical protein